MMDNIESRLKPSVSEQYEPKPSFFNLADTKDEERLLELLGANPHISIIDTYENQLLDFFVLQQPWLHLNHEQRDKEFEGYKKEHYADQPIYRAGMWVYLPWRAALLHVLEDEKYQEVRTARNRNLITPEEQKKFYNSVIGIAGQSVGNSCTLAIVQMGGGKHLRLADPDTLELTNLNRIRGSIAEITNYKVHMAAHQIYELDPYASLDLFTDGLTEENIQKFFDGPPALDVVIDEIDNLGMKVRIRQEAQKRGIAVVSAADNGEGGVLEIERYDLDRDTKFFNGRTKEAIAERVVGKKLPLPAIGKIITEELIGADVITPRTQQSLLEIGSSVPTWPQLGGAAWLNGVAVSIAARRIITDQPLIKDRVVMSPEAWLIPGYNSSEEVEKRARDTKQFIEDLNKKFSIPL